MKNITTPILTKSYSSTKALAVGLLLLSGLATAQTINNPDFETLATAGTYPTMLSQMGKAAGWTQPTGGTADYYYGSPNPTPYLAKIPGTTTTINPQSGSAYAGLYAENITYGATTNYKEYLTNRLSTKLTAGVTYRITFYTMHLYGTNNTDVWSPTGNITDLLPAEQGFLGICFSNVSPTSANTSTVGAASTPAGAGGILNSWNPTKRALIPASNTAVYGVASRNTWVPVTLSYTADGTEEYITVGQWREAPTAMTAPLGTSNTIYNASAAYYLFDNFSFAACAAGTTAPALSN